MKPKMPKVLQVDGQNNVPVFPLSAGCIKSTLGAATIDTSELDMIYFGDDVTIYIEDETSATIEIQAGHTFGCAEIASIHVAAAVPYMIRKTVLPKDFN